ncbi:MAG TPA: glycosyltransferase family 39 protein [Ohtaekwangia sp.]
MSQRLTRPEKLTLGILGFTCFLFHVIVNVNGAYGFFRDELYYLACSDHLALGYVDQPPFSIYLLKLSRLIFGDSLTAIRLIPSLAHAGTVVLAGLISREMGGKVYAIFLSAFVVMLTPILIGMSSFYSMNSIDILIWSLAIWVILKIVNTREEKYWRWLGIVLGIGLLNKISVLFLGAGIFVGFMVIDRKWFTTRWPYFAGILAFILFAPYVVWNLTHDLAHLEFIHNASAGKYSGRSPLDFVSEQFLYLNPVAAPLWIGGLIVLFVYKPLREYRLIGLIYLTAFIILLLNRTSKGEYLAPAYACLFAAASVFIEQKFVNASLNWIRYVYPALILVSVIILLPMILPVLPVEKYIKYAKSIGFEPSSSENKELAELPQFYADMFGWKEKAADVARVYNSLPEDEKATCTIISTNYGRCGAIDFFGEQYGLPKSIGLHNNYWLWGPGDYTGKEVLIILGGKLADHKDDFESVELAGVSECQYCMPYENHVNIFICRGLKFPVQDSWAAEKNYE